MKREYVALFGAVSLSERFASLDDAAGRFYLLLLAQCDAWGRITAKPRTLNAMVWPLCGKTAEQTAAAVDAIVAAGMLERHARDGKEWLQVPVEDWESKAGRLTPAAKRGRSEWPEPSENSRLLRATDGGAQSTPATDPPRESAPENSGVLRSTLLREEKKREEQRTVEPSPTPPRGRGDTSSAGEDLEDAFAEAEAQLERPPDPAYEIPHAPPKRARRKPADIDPRTAPLPPEIDTPRVREELAAWIARRVEVGHPPLGPVGFSRVVAQLAPRGAEYAASALGIAADRGWRGLRASWVDSEGLSRPGSAPTSGPRAAHGSNLFADELARKAGHPLGTIDVAAVHVGGAA